MKEEPAGGWGMAEMGCGSRHSCASPPGSMPGRARTNMRAQAPDSGGVSADDGVFPRQMGHQA